MIRLQHILNESVTTQGVTLTPANPKSGGPILATYNGVTYKYRVSVNTMFYDGPVGITHIWEKSSGEYRVKDNTGKVFPFTRTNINDIIRSIKQQSKQIAITTTGADITLTRVA